MAKKKKDGVLEDFTIGEDPHVNVAVPEGAGAMVGVLPISMREVFNPGPDALTGEYAGGFYDIPAGESVMSKDAADHFAGLPGCPGGTFGKLGLRQFGSMYTEAQKAPVRFDAIRAAYLFRRDHSLPIPEEMAATAKAVIDGVVDSTVPSVAEPPEPVAPPGLAHPPMPQDGETFDPRIHRPQNRSDAFAETFGFHDRMKDITLTGPK